MFFFKTFPQVVQQQRQMQSALVGHVAVRLAEGVVADPAGMVKRIQAVLNSAIKP